MCGTQIMNAEDPKDTRYCCRTQKTLIQSASRILIGAGSFLPKEHSWRSRTNIVHIKIRNVYFAAFPKPKKFSNRTHDDIAWCFVELLLLNPTVILITATKRHSATAPAIAATVAVHGQARNSRRSTAAFFPLASTTRSSFCHIQRIGHLLMILRYLGFSEPARNSATLWGC